MSLKKRILGALKNDFNKNFVTLFSGSAFAQVIPLLASILLARIYSPEEFGVVSIFSSLVLIFLSVVNLRYEFAIPLAKDDNEAVAVTLLSGIIAIIFSVLLLLAFYIFKSEILALIGGESLGSLIYLVPLSVLFAGMFNCLNYFNLRLKKFKVIAGSNILKSLSGAIMQFGFGVTGFTHSGLVLGYGFSFLFGNVRMFRIFYNYRKTVMEITKSDLICVAKRFRHFPLISIWGIFLNNLSVNINNFFISRFFGLNQLGLYSYSYRYINAPLSLITSNIGQLFYQVCAEKKNENKPAGKEFVNILKKLLIICVPLFIFLFFFIKDLFVLVFGSKWEVAGYYASILVPLFFIRTIFAPLSLVNTAFERQSLALLMQLTIFLGNLFSISYSYFNNFSIAEFLNLYTYLGSFIYLILTIVTYFVANKKI